MGRIFSGIIVTLFCTIFLVATAQAKAVKEVYLKDGGIIICQKAWRSDGKVLVLVNRDTLVDFSKDEVDLKKTFARKQVAVTKKAKAGKKVAGKKAAAATSAPLKPTPVRTALPAAAQGSSPQTVERPRPAQPAHQPIKPQQVAANQAPPATKVQPPAAVKLPIQKRPSSAKKQHPPVAAPLPRTELPPVKSTPPVPPQPSFFQDNMLYIGLAALLILLLVLIVVRKKR